MSTDGRSVLPPRELRDFLLVHDQCPLVFSGCIGDWPAREWTLPHLASVLGDQRVQCRLGLKDKQSIQWESECQYEEIKLREYLEWTEGRCSPGNPLLGYHRDTYWAYVDYKYMRDLFSLHPQVLKEVCWGRFGFPDLDGEQSTIWIGSEQAYTLGHYDTYGCNLVAQISGRKRWLLFPPSQTERLYPTRVPLEESSVFSDINITRPDLHKHPKFQGVTPYVVELDPGQVLFVPRHWWHFVECLQPAISVNVWIELASDDADRLKEAVTTAVVCAMLPETAEAETWLNPNQSFLSVEESRAQIEQVLRLMEQKASAGRGSGPSTCSDPPAGLESRKGYNGDRSANPRAGPNSDSDPPADPRSGPPSGSDPSAALGSRSNPGSDQTKTMAPSHSHDWTGTTSCCADKDTRKRTALSCVLDSSTHLDRERTKRSKHGTETENTIQKVKPDSNLPDTQEAEVPFVEEIKPCSFETYLSVVCADREEKTSCESLKPFSSTLTDPSFELAQSRECTELEKTQEKTLESSARTPQQANLGEAEFSDSASPPPNQRLPLRTLVNCFAHPQVISLVSQLLIEQYKESKNS